MLNRGFQGEETSNTPPPLVWITMLLFALNPTPESQEPNRKVSTMARGPREPAAVAVAEARGPQHGPQSGARGSRARGPWAVPAARSPRPI